LDHAGLKDVFTLMMMSSCLINSGTTFLHDFQVTVIDKRKQKHPLWS